MIVSESQIDISTYIVLRLLRILRFLEIFKLYQLFKGIQSLLLLASTLKQSISDFFIVLLEGIIFATPTVSQQTSHAGNYFPC